jgi:hypothetical protein
MSIRSTPRTIQIPEGAEISQVVQDGKVYNQVRTETTTTLYPSTVTIIDVNGNSILTPSNTSPIVSTRSPSMSRRSSRVSPSRIISSKRSPSRRSPSRIISNRRSPSVKPATIISSQPTSVRSQSDVSMKENDWLESYKFSPDDEDTVSFRKPSESFDMSSGLSRKSIDSSVHSAAKSVHSVGKSPSKLPVGFSIRQTDMYVNLQVPAGFVGSLVGKDDHGHIHNITIDTSGEILHSQL